MVEIVIICLVHLVYKLWHVKYTQLVCAVSTQESFFRTNENRMWFSIQLHVNRICFLCIVV